MASSPIVLILGSGPRIGLSVAQKFAANGYKVAVASRSGGTSKTTAEGFLSLKADLSQPNSVPALFAAVQAEWKAAPSVVVYNAATLTPPPVEGALFSLPTEAVVSDLNVNTISAYVAAQQAVSGWETLAPEVKKTFIYTGNILNLFVSPMPLMLTLGMGKSASAYWIGVADAVYSSKGSRFFYVDERFSDGALKGGAIDGEAHASFYAQLATHEGNVPWLATFVKDKGYVEFK